MANRVDHYLKAPNLKQLLLDAGVIGPKTLHSANNIETYHEHVLDMKKCDEEYWKEVEKTQREHDTKLSLEEIEELHFWPIEFESDDEISWVCKWNNNNDPVNAISKLFPDISFEYELFYEGEWDGAFTVKNGVFERTADWDLELIRRGENNEDDDPEETLPF